MEGENKQKTKLEMNQILQLISRKTPTQIFYNPSYYIYLFILNSALYRDLLFYLPSTHTCFPPGEHLW